MITIVAALVVVVVSIVGWWALGRRGKENVLKGEGLTRRLPEVGWRERIVFMTVPQKPLHEQTRDWSLSMGPLVGFSPMPWRRYVLCRDAEVCQQARNFPKPPFSQMSFREVGRFGLLAMQDDVHGAGDTGTALWRRHRRLMQPFFALGFVRRMAPQMLECADGLLEVLRANPQGKALDTHAALTALTLDVVCRTSLGFRLGTVDGSLRAAFREVIQWIADFQMRPVAFLWRHFPTARRSRFLAALRHVHALIHSALISASSSSPSATSSTGPTFLEALLNAREDDEKRNETQEKDTLAGRVEEEEEQGVSVEGSVGGSVEDSVGGSVEGTCVSTAEGEIAVVGGGEGGEDDE